MNNHNLYIKFTLACVNLLVGLMVYANSTNELRTSFETYLKTQPPSFVSLPALTESGVASNKEYINFAQMVSNDYKTVFANVNTITTNQAERLLVFAVGWQFGEEFYLSCLEELADLGLKGEVTAFEVKWYRYLNFDSKYTNMLRVRYKEPRIIELVKKLMQVEPDAKKYYEKILTGESYQEYLEEMKARLWG